MKTSFNSNYVPNICIYDGHFYGLLYIANFHNSMTTAI